MTLCLPEIWVKNPLGKSNKCHFSNIAHTLHTCVQKHRPSGSFSTGCNTRTEVYQQQRTEKSLMQRRRPAEYSVPLLRALTKAQLLSCKAEIQTESPAKRWRVVLRVLRAFCCRTMRHDYY